MTPARSSPGHRITCCWTLHRLRSESAKHQPDPVRRFHVEIQLKVCLQHVFHYPRGTAAINIPTLEPVIEDQSTNAKTVPGGRQRRVQDIIQHPQAIRSNLLTAVTEIPRRVIDCASKSLGPCPMAGMPGLAGSWIRVSQESR
jgi:hypothetical protein